MKVRWFLRGLGIGIVITALVLCITYRNGRKGNDIIRQAKEMGMVFPKNETEDVSPSGEEPKPDESEGKEQENTPEEAVSGTSVQADEQPDPEADQDTDQKDEQKLKDKLDKSSADITQASQFQGNKKTFVVRSGLLSSSVAREMQEAGIIDDADAFDDYVEKNGYGRLVRSGKYDIPDGADYETIAKIITRQ